MGGGGGGDEKTSETRMANNQTLRRYAASYKQYRPLAQKRNAAKSPQPLKNSIVQS